MFSNAREEKVKINLVVWTGSKTNSTVNNLSCQVSQNISWLGSKVKKDFLSK